MAVITESQRVNRIALVEEHVRAERAHDVEATLNTVGANPRFQINDVPLDTRDAVSGFYNDMFQGFPDLEIEVTNRFVTDEAIILEVILRGTHKGTWADIPPSGRRNIPNAPADNQVENSNRLICIIFDATRGVSARISEASAGPTQPCVAADGRMCINSARRRNSGHPRETYTELAVG